jgi:hypothetical protein
MCIATDLTLVGAVIVVLYGALFGLGWLIVHRLFGKIAA